MILDTNDNDNLNNLIMLNRKLDR